MAQTALQDIISTYRGGSQGTGASHAGLLSKLKIGDNLYDIKDPAVEQLASAVETRISTLEASVATGTTWTPVSKGEGVGQFATSVAQDEHGAITVIYGNVLSSQYNDAAVAGQYVTQVTQGVDGAIAVSRTGIDASVISFSGTGYTGTNVKDALVEARIYTDSAVNALAGEDWTKAAKTVHEIVQEIEGSTGASAWVTTIDKLNGMEWAATGTQGEPGYVAGNDDPTVVEYVQHEIAKVNAKNAAGIESLDATVGSTGVATGKHVAVQVVEEDGLLTSLIVTEDDIASATGLAALDAVAVKNVNGATGNSITLYGTDINLSSATGTSLTDAITGLGSDKANKAAIGTGTVNSWNTPTYDGGTETLALSYTGVDVYIPVSGQSL